MEIEIKAFAIQKFPFFYYLSAVIRVRYRGKKNWRSEEERS